MTTYTTKPTLETVTEIGNVLDTMAASIKYLNEEENLLLVNELLRIHDDLFKIQEALYQQWTNAVSASLFASREAK